jgi:hypothetical protein
MKRATTGERKTEKCRFSASCGSNKNNVRGSIGCHFLGKPIPNGAVANKISHRARRGGIILWMINHDL